ncbi:MAG: serine hydroxymethyltransferase [Deltaproteobacteria bacterium]|jgi:glycine hydroxymethyltransferase|nr:serine hydroxymethyltransferase [Deltaproteobacteria bacterium]
MAYLVQDDPEVARIIRDEESRVACTLNLIAAENHAPRSVLEAQGSIFSLKAAEGFPGKRFHAGCRHADELESLAVSRAKLLFGADHANVQPHSGVSANLAVYFSVLDVGDRILSMKLSHGGHLSHGDAASMTSRCFDFQHYGLNLKTEQIDYNEVENLATAFRPRMIIAGASSYPRLIDYERIAKTAQSVSAILLVDMAHIAGLVAAKVIPSPVPHADFVTFTTYKTLRAGRGGVILCKQKYADRINRAIFPGGQGTPSLNLIAAKAVCFHLARTADFVEMQNKTLKNAGCFAAEFERLGYRIVSGGTDNHLVLFDLRSRGLTGALAEGVLESVGIVVNRNVIPADPERPEVSSGIRIGSPAITSRGMQEPEVRQIARMMDIAMSNAENERVLNRVAQQVRDLCKQFPIQP